MTKTYELTSSNVEDEQKTITISEDVTKTEKEKTSIAQLKIDYASKLDKIELVKAQANAIVDEIQAINDNVDLDITVKEIPKKL